MPIIERITPVADSDDVTRWRFCVRVPIVAPIVWEFVMRRRVNAETGEIAYSSPEDAPDFFQCDVHVRPNPNGATDADVRLLMRVWRPRARDIHPLAGLVGEQWIGRVVADRMDKMATAFVTSGLREIQAQAEAGRAAAPPPVAAPIVNGHRDAYPLTAPSPSGALEGCPQPAPPAATASVAEDGSLAEAGAADGLSSNRTESSFETPGSGIVTP